MELVEREYKIRRVNRRRRASPHHRLDRATEADGSESTSAHSTDDGAIRIELALSLFWFRLTQDVRGERSCVGQ